MVITCFLIAAHPISILRTQLASQTFIRNVEAGIGFLEHADDIYSMPPTVQPDAIVLQDHSQNQVAEPHVSDLLALPAIFVFGLC